MPRNKQVMPACAYGASCQRKGCVYQHPKASKAAANFKGAPAPVIIKSTREICVYFVSGLCTFGDKCLNKHPGRKEVDAFRMTCSRVACKYGDACASAACLYAHDGGGRIHIPKQPPLPAFPLPVDKWWQREMGEDLCDPISLEPLNSLEYPPFSLLSSNNSVEHWFDGAVLAVYVVSTANFVNPMTRDPLTRDDAVALDDYLRLNDIEKRPKVTQAYDILHSTAVNGDMSALRREATTILQSLFGFAEQGDDEEEEENGEAHVISYQGAAYTDSFETRLNHNSILDDDDDGAASLGNLDDAMPVRIAEAILANEDSDEDDHNYGNEDDYPPPAAVDLSDEAFPSLPNAPAQCSVSGGDYFTLSFAELALSPASLPTANSSIEKQERAVVTLPQDLWTSSDLRNARAFEILDPLQRYRHVNNRAPQRTDVVDLHYQSTRTAPLVLDAVLEDALNNTKCVWVITGSGHHVPTHAHQRHGGTLHAFVDAYLAESNYDYAYAKDSRGYFGAFLVRRQQQQQRHHQYHHLSYDNNNNALLHSIPGGRGS